MESISKEEILFIFAGNGYTVDGIKKEGYKIQHPYYCDSIVLRIIREIFFRVPFLPKSFFYRKDYISPKIKYVIIYDPLITKHYITWLMKKIPNAQFNFKYRNLVGLCTHLAPKEIPNHVRIWTYDDKDAEKYGLRLDKKYSYFENFIKKSDDIKYDVLFVGRDKGRGDFLIDFEKRLNQAGLRTFFVITKDGKFSRSKYYYKKEISYDDLTEAISHTKAILNIGMPKQKGMTLRDFESLYFDKKLITNVENIVNQDLYCPENVLVIKDFGNETVADISSFLKIENKNMDNVKKEHSFQKAIMGMVSQE